MSDYEQGRKDAAEAIRALAADWPAHYCDYVVRTALAKAVIVAEGGKGAIPT